MIWIESSTVGISVPPYQDSTRENYGKTSHNSTIVVFQNSPVLHDKSKATTGANGWNVWVDGLIESEVPTAVD